MSDRDEDEDEEMQAQWNEDGVTVIHEFRSGGEGGGGGGGGGGADLSNPDAETTVVYEYRVDSDDGSESGGGFAPTLPADDIAVGGSSPDASSGPELTAAAPTRVRVPWTPTPKVSVWLTNEATTRFGIGHPTNTGSAPLNIVAMDAQGQNVGGIELLPGQSVAWYYPPPSAVRVGVAHALVDPSPDTELTYDTPIY